MADNSISKSNIKIPAKEKGGKRKKRRLEYRFSAVIFMLVVFLLAGFIWFMLDAGSKGIAYYETGGTKQTTSADSGTESETTSGTDTASTEE